jgi:hypothetical protein
VSALTLRTRLFRTCRSRQPRHQGLSLVIALTLSRR